MAPCWSVWIHYSWCCHFRPRGQSTPARIARSGCWNRLCCGKRPHDPGPQPRTARCGADEKRACRFSTRIVVEASMGSRRRLPASWDRAHVSCPPVHTALLGAGHSRANDPPCGMVGFWFLCAFRNSDYHFGPGRRSPVGFLLPDCTCGHYKNILGKRDNSPSGWLGRGCDSERCGSVGFVELGPSHRLNCGSCLRGITCCCWKCKVVGHHSARTLPPAVRGAPTLTRTSTPGSIMRVLPAASDGATAARIVTSIDIRSVPIGVPYCCSSSVISINS